MCTRILCVHFLATRALSRGITNGNGYFHSVLTHADTFLSMFCCAHASFSLPAFTGYTPQLAVPLYVRNTLEEKEGTSLHGDPTKEELAQDRRYSHYLGRPLVRFNPSVTLPEHLSSHATGLEKDESKSPRAEAQTSSLTEPVLDLSALTLSTKERAAQQQKMDKKLRKELKKAQEEVRHLPITNSLVRIVFNNPEPSLSDLKYLDEIV